MCGSKPKRASSMPIGPEERRGLSVAERSRGRTGVRKNQAEKGRRGKGVGPKKGWVHIVSQKKRLGDDVHPLGERVGHFWDL